MQKPEDLGIIQENDSDFVKSEYFSKINGLLKKMKIYLCLTILMC